MTDDDAKEKKEFTLENACEQVINTCMNLQKEEKLLIVFDENKRDIAQGLADVAQNVSHSVFLLKMPVGRINGEEPGNLVKTAMQNCDVCILVTSVSYSHTDARRTATEKGVRIASMPGITEEIMIRTMSVDYYKVRDFSMQLKELIDKTENVRITTEKGTDISMSVKGRTALKPGGLLHDKGDFGNLPSGEVCLAPVEGTTNGNFIIDGSIIKQLVDKDIKVEVKDGYAVDIQGGKIAEELKAMLDIVGKEAYNIAELGIGTNKGAKVTGNTLEDEKVYGTCHLAFGNSMSFGGKVDVPIHLDGVFFKPTIYFDDKIVFKDGEFVG